MTLKNNARLEFSLDYSQAFPQLVDTLGYKVPGLISSEVYADPSLKRVTLTYEYYVDINGNMYRSYNDSLEKIK